MLNLERLRVLHAVAVTGSVAGAAATLHVTTSAISQQLARLEREVGQQLLGRSGRGVRLTEAGAQLAGDAEDLLARVERVEAGLASRRGVVAGTVRIGAFATAARGLLPQVLAGLRADYPELVAVLSEVEPIEAIPLLRKGELDLAVVQDWAGDELGTPPGMSTQDLLTDVFDVALPVRHPLAVGPSVTVGQLVDADWITWSVGQLCHDWLSSTVRPAGVRHTASEHSTQLALVAAGLGIALIPRLGRGCPPDGIRFVPVDPPLTRRVFALWRDSATDRPSVGAALTALTVHSGRISGSTTP